MRINGRLLRPSTLAERRLLLSFGTPFLRVPRKVNPYAVARRLQRIAGGRADDLLVREVVLHSRRTFGPSPEVDTSSPPSEAVVDATRTP